MGRFSASMGTGSGRAAVRSAALAWVAGCGVEGALPLDTGDQLDQLLRATPAVSADCGTLKKGIYTNTTDHVMCKQVQLTSNCATGGRLQKTDDHGSNVGDKMDVGTGETRDFDVDFPAGYGLDLDCGGSKSEGTNCCTYTITSAVCDAAPVELEVREVSAR